MKSLAVTALLALLPKALALGQKQTVTLAAGDGQLQLAGHDVHGQILLSANDWWGVLRAAEDLAGDFGKVTGWNLTLGNWVTGGADKEQSSSSEDGENDTTTKGGKTTAVYTYFPTTSDVNYTVGPAKHFSGPTLISNSKDKPVIIAGTIGKSDVINALASSGKLDTSTIEGSWESFSSQVIEAPLPGVEKALVIAGSDLRGTIFGLYDVSEQIGVSPWWWFADVPVRKSHGVWALPEVKKIQGEPSVKYRGIFINDEQPGLTNWIDENYERGPYGAGFNHYFYPHVFELLLRLRANYFWPAMWGSMFSVDDTANQPLADAYGIVMGTSHTEPLARATNEWNNFGSGYGGNGEWEYDTNNKSLDEFFRYGAQRANPYRENTLLTIAMRGSGDTSINMPPEQAAEVLKNVVNSQRKILGEVFEGKDITEIPQVWCLYKEVMGYYDDYGLTVPDDVTLLWVDDNWGNVRRLPLASETNRSGGAGVYYHVDYVGDPRNYKWINTIQLEKTVEQMQLSYERQADRVWILNVGDLKAVEIPLNHFLDMAYDTPLWDYDSVPTWLKLWAAREFGHELADRIASVVERYGTYAAWRKYELIDPATYNVINYNEADAILTQWESLASDAQDIYDALDAASQASFYELVLHPVLGGQAVTQIHIGAGKNGYFVEQKRNSANAIAQSVLSTFQKDHALTQRYHDLLGGKWNHILDQPHLGYSYWQQPMRNAIPPLAWVQELETSVAGNVGVGVEASNATVSGDDNYHDNSGITLVLPPMDPYGPKTRWIDIFARGGAGCEWTVAPWEDYVIANPPTGTVGGHNGTDARVYISVDWTQAPAAPNVTVVNINVTSSCPNWGNYAPPLVQVPVVSTIVADDFKGFVESDGHVSIEAEHTAKQTEANGVSYRTLPGHGRTLSGVTLVPVLADTQPAGTGPVLEYSLYTFTNTSNAKVTLYLSPSLNQNGADRPLKYAIAFDDEDLQEVQFVADATDGKLPEGWEGAVSDNIWGLSSGNSTTTSHDLTKTGHHTLKIWSIEPGVVFQKIVVDLGGVRPSYLGPPESFRAGVDKVGKYDGTNALGVKINPKLQSGSRLA